MNLNELLYDLLYNKSEEELIKYIRYCKDSKMLHFIAANYNWDDGFNIPSEIIKNKYCDIGTALMLFENAEGFTLFFEEEWNESLNENTKFVNDLRKKIEQREFTHKNIKYSPELSRSDIYRLNKLCPEIDKIFIQGTKGEELEIPVL